MSTICHAFVYMSNRDRVQHYVLIHLCELNVGKTRGEGVLWVDFDARGRDTLSLRRSAHVFNKIRANGQAEPDSIIIVSRVGDRGADLTAHQLFICIQMKAALVPHSCSVVK